MNKPKTKKIISTCLLGIKCRWDGKEKFNEKQEKEYLKFILRKIKNREAIYLYLDFEGEVIGSCGITVANHTIQKHIGEIGIILNPAAHGMGLGKKLFQKVLAEGIKKLKFKIVRLDIFSKNKIAINMYKSFGFEKIGTIKGGASLYGKYLDNDIMVKYIK